MPDRDSLGTRMKTYYEEVPKFRLYRRTPVAIRIDGKAFCISLTETVRCKLLVGKYHAAGSVFKYQLEVEVITASGIHDICNLNIYCISIFVNCKT